MELRRLIARRDRAAIRSGNHDKEVMTTMDLSIRVAFSAIDKLTRPVNAASKTVGRLSDSLKNTIFSQGFGKRRCVVRQVAHEGQRNRAEPENTQRALTASIRNSGKAASSLRRRRRARVVAQ